MQIDRKQFVKELELRKQIRKAIKIVSERKRRRRSKQLQEEASLRKIIRRIINETTVGSGDPERATGINELERVLEEIIKIIEQDYKRLTTSEEQRLSFRTHIVKGVQNLLAPERATDAASGTLPAEPMMEQEIDIEIGDEEDDAFIDVRGEKEKEEEKSPEEEFGIEGEDETGRNFAYETFTRIEKQIMKGYNRLGDVEDKNLFYDYLITNLKLYFDKFEDELRSVVAPEPTTPEYEREKDAQGGGGDIGLAEDSDEDVFDLGN